MRPGLPIAVVGLEALLLVLVGACAEPNFGADDEVALPDRAEPLNPGDAAKADTSPPDVSPADASLDSADAAPSLRVFVTSSTYKANLGGVSGADVICTNLAAVAGRGGTWAAWLSNNAAGSPQAIGRVTSAGPWRLVSGEIVADTKAGLVSGTLKHAIDHDENGVAVAAGRVWTGTGPNGTYLTNDCDQWTTGGSGRVGVTSALDGTWTSAGVDDCGNLRHLYCFQL